jgi:hypothetical protein
MKRTLVASLVVAATIVSTALAQETPEAQLDFVRKLRAKGWHDLNKEYIDELIKQYPAIAGQLSLEQARSLVALGRIAKNLDQRSALLNQARNRLQTFVTEYAGKPEATQARVELAKLVAYHGQTILAKALHDYDEPKDQYEAARKAELLFIQAGEELEGLLKQLTGKEQTQARLERAVNLMDQARTYIDTDKEAVNRKRGELMAEARKIFVGMSADESPEVGLLANAWLVKCNLDLQAPKDADKHYNKVLGAKEPPPFAAQRLARYFYIAGIPKNVTITGNKLKMVKDEATKWIKDYGPSTINTWEGQGVRFELANAYLAEAQSVKDLKSPAAQGLLGQAQKLYASLADLDGEFSEEANRRNIFIAVTKLEKVDLKEIRDFDNSLLKAYFELYSQVKKVDEKLADDKLKEPERKKLESERRQHLHEAQRALTQALNLRTSSTPVAKIDEARFLRMQTYYRMGELSKAVVAGRDLAEARSKRSPQGAGLAIRALDELINRLRWDADRQQMRNLVEFILSPESQKYWQADPVTAVARYQLAMMAKDEKDFATAVDNLEQLPTDFAGYVYAQGQLAFIAIAAADDKSNKLTEAERKQLRARARKAIGRMPSSLPADTDPTTATMYYHAQMEEPKSLYREAAEDLRAQKFADASGKYKQMGKIIEQHHAAFKKSTVKFEEKTKKDLDTMMTVFGKYAKLGLADVEYRMGRYDQVLSFNLVGPLMQEVEAKAKTPGKIRVKDHVVAGEILALALRTYVQKGELDRAQVMFDILERLAGDDDNALQNDTSILFSIVNDIEQHVIDLEKAKDTEKLKTAIDNYSKFIDGIADSILKKSSRPKDYISLANAYAMLKQPAKAAELYGKLPLPKQIKDVDEELERRAKAKKPGYSDGEVAKLKDRLVDDEYARRPELKKPEYMAKAGASAEEIDELKTRLADLKNTVAADVGKERQEYWYLQIQYAKSLREGKDYKKAFGTLERLINHPLGEFHVLAAMEKNRVFEDNSTFGPAIKGWQELLGRLRPKAEIDETIKRLYFDCYYEHARCWFRYSQAPKTANDKKEAALTNAARYIVSLENAKLRDGWDAVGDRFERLMGAEPMLKAAYEKLKKAAPAPAGK